jgi:hypothetical protein
VKGPVLVRQPPTSPHPKQGKVIPGGLVSDGPAKISKTAAGERILWQPQPKQAIALTSPVYELFYGGARGGGKSDFLLMDFTKQVQKWGKAHRGVIFRKTYPELEELLRRATELYGPLGATFHRGERTWTFPQGSTLKMRHLEADDDVHHYQGHQYTWVGFDELTDWKSDYCYVYLHSCARSAEGVPVRIRAAGNPGGPGHVWVKQRFVDIGLSMEPHLDQETGLLRVFIPAKLDDNQVLMKADPTYEMRLKTLPEHLYKAYRWGDWDIFAGQAFGEWRASSHVVKPFGLHPDWRRFAALDWGYAKPYSIGWWCRTGDGRMIRYREWYGCEKGKHNVGIKKSAVELARESFAVGSAEGCKDLVMDPACWSKVDTDQSIAEKFEAAGWHVHRGINDRKSGASRLHDLLQSRMDDGRPGLIVFDTCSAFARTIPSLVVSDRDPEDVDTTGEDHCFPAGTMISTPAGRRAIETLRRGDMVLTRKGPRAVLDLWDEGRYAMVCAHFTGGHTLEGTASHKVWVYGRGFVPLGKMAAGDEVCILEEPWAPRIARRARSGPGVTGPSPMDTSSTTETATPKTIASKIWNAFQSSIMRLGIAKGSRGTTGSEAAGAPRSGTEAKRGNGGTGNTPRASGPDESRLRGSARSAASRTSRGPWGKGSTARGVVVRRRFVGLTPGTTQQVYDLSVKGEHEYFAEGVLVSNCYDETRYALMSRLTTHRVAATPEDASAARRAQEDYDPLRWGL